MQGLGKCRAALIVAAFALLVGYAPALADPFNTDEVNRLHERHRNFMDSLGEVGDQMRHDHDWSNSQQASRSHADQMSIQNGTQAQAQESFLNSQMQAQQSGGLYNGNGSFNYGNGIGAFGIGGFGLGAPILTIEQQRQLQQYQMQQQQLQHQPATTAHPAATTNQSHQDHIDRFNDPHYDPFGGFTLPSSSKQKQKQ